MKTLKLIPQFIIAVVLTIFFGCKKEDNGNSLPILNTNNVSGITQINAICGGNIENDGGNPILERGVCWSTNKNPTTSNSKTSDGTGIGSYTSSINNLTENTTYYVRAYATNKSGTGYGNIISFTTKKGETVTDIDGNIYHTVTIGSQTWMLENLKVSHYQNGDEIPNVSDVNLWVNQTSGAYCINDNNENNNLDYGKLYNFYAIKDPRKLCPPGWHIPSNEEWETLVLFLGENYINKLKDTGTSYWADPNDEATNESGFTALPGGSRDSKGTFGGIGHYSFWWTSSSFAESYAYYRWFGDKHNVLNKTLSSYNYGLSVRCIKD